MNYELQMTSREEKNVNGVAIIETTYEILAMEIVVEDDGSGVLEEDKKKLFTRGFGKNTGLGLFLSREILSITGIGITETGQPGVGARFELSVPSGMFRIRG